MADGWANFSSNERSHNAQQVEDEDWDDFGGFEGAEPMLAQQDVSQVEASPSPWAVFSAGGAGPAQPDLLIPPAQPPLQKMDHPFLNNAAPEVTSNRGGSVPCQGAVGGQPELTMQAQASVRQAVVQADRQMSLKDMDVGLALDDNLDIIGSRKIGNSSVNGSRNQMAGNALEKQPRELSTDRQSNASVESQPHAPRRVETEMPEQLSAVDKERDRLQQKLQEMGIRNQQLREELDKEKSNLQEEQTKYAALESKHETDIAELRKAGHDTLAIMLEEYKGLCKCSILEQQEANEQRLKEELAKESEKCQALMLQQHEELVKLLKDERKANEEQTNVTIAELTKKHEEDIENVISDQQQKAEELSKKAIEKMEEKHIHLMEELIAQEKGKTNIALENERKLILEMIEKEKKKNQELLTEALKGETDKSKAAIREALSEERKSQDEANKFAAEKTKSLMLEHLKEQKNADSAVRQRSLASIDLFLEGARQQLQMLLESPLKSSNEEQSS